MVQREQTAARPRRTLCTPIQIANKYLPLDSVRARPASAGPGRRPLGMRRSLYLESEVGEIGTMTNDRRFDRFPYYVRIDFQLFGPIFVCSVRFPFVWIDFQLFGPISIFCSVRFLFVSFDFHLFGSISICSVRFPFVRFDFNVFGSITICSVRFPFVRSDFHLFGSISICSVRFPFVRFDFHLFGPISIPDH
jgi:hypothetical protein